MNPNDPKSNLDALASQFGELRPASGIELQGDVFYRAGVAAAKRELQASYRGRFLKLCAASLLVVSASGFGGFYLGSTRSDAVLVASDSVGVGNDKSGTEVVDLAKDPIQERFATAVVSGVDGAMDPSYGDDPVVLPWVRWARDKWIGNRELIAAAKHEAYANILNPIPVREVRQRVTRSTAVPLPLDPFDSLYPRSLYSKPRRGLGFKNLFPML